MHRWDIYFEENKGNYLPYRVFLFKKLNKVFPISNQGKNYYNKWFEQQQDKIEVSRLGVKQLNLNPFNKSTKLLLLSISNMIPVKNIEVLIEALAQLNIDFHWTHIGDGPLRTKLETQANEQIPGKYTFKGRLPNSEVLEYLQNEPTDLFINVSLSEGIPVSIMEAFSCGIPALVTVVGGNDEIVNNENGIILTAKTTPKEIVSALFRFNNFPSTQKNIMKQAAYNTWRNEYNASKNYSSFVKQIKELQY